MSTNKKQDKQTLHSNTPFGYVFNKFVVTPVSLIGLGFVTWMDLCKKDMSRGF